MSIERDKQDFEDCLSDLQTVCSNVINEYNHHLTELMDENEELTDKVYDLEQEVERLKYDSSE